MKATLWMCVVVGLALAPSEGRAQSPAPGRVAVLVGANKAAPGRKPLRYSHDDVKSVAGVLIDLGGFAAEDVVTLYDPNPAKVLAVLDERLGELAQSATESMLVFYYSGHADAQSLFPNGKSLALAEVRARMESAGPSLRLGLVDACRGGGWTSVKGLVPTDSFAIDLPMELASEGSAFISSSSGLEDAHESEALGGLFFTHHWVAALRGVGDRDQDGRVTLSESFDYAKEMTIRDTALVADAPQHPSFQYNLRGRMDLPLATLDQRRTLIALEQSRGPLQLVDLQSGLIVLEVPAGEKRMKLAVPPGKYLVRRRDRERTLAREVSVTSGEVTAIDEANLEVMAMPQPVTKEGGLPRRVMNTTRPKGVTELSFALGVAHGTQPTSLGFADTNTSVAFGFGALRGISDRLQWHMPGAFAYRFGDPGGLEIVPWGGATFFGVGWSSVEALVLTAGLGLGSDMRWWLGPRSSLNLGVGLTSSLQVSWGDYGRDMEPEKWRLATSLGYSLLLGEYVSLHPSLCLGQNLTQGDRWTGTEWSEESIHWTNASFNSKGRDAALEIGACQSFGLRQLPLVQIDLGDVWSIDLHAAATYEFAVKKVRETYMLGSTWTW